MGGKLHRSQGNKETCQYGRKPLWGQIFKEMNLIQNYKNSALSRFSFSMKSDVQIAPCFRKTKEAQRTARQIPFVIFSPPFLPTMQHGGGRKCHSHPWQITSVLRIQRYGQSQHQATIWNVIRSRLGKQTLHLAKSISVSAALKGTCLIQT